MKLDLWRDKSNDKDTHMPNHGNLIDISGIRYGRLLVIKRAGTHIAKGGHTFPTWYCICDCGTKKTIIGYALRSGGTRSCGCINIESTTPKNSMFTRYKRMAKQRNLPFELLKKKFFSLLDEKCYYCGAEPTRRKSTPPGHNGFKANGIDRLNSMRGYIKGNVVPCCPHCNQAKNDLSVKEFLSLIRKIYYFSNRTKSAS